MRYKNSLTYQAVPQQRLINEPEFLTDENLDDDGLLRMPYAHISTDNCLTVPANSLKVRVPPKAPLNPSPTKFSKHQPFDDENDAMDIGIHTSSMFFLLMSPLRTDKQLVDISNNSSDDSDSDSSSSDDDTSDEETKAKKKAKKEKKKAKKAEKKARKAEKKAAKKGKKKPGREEIEAMRKTKDEASSKRKEFDGKSQNGK